MKAAEFETKAWDVDGIRVVIRANKSADVNDFPRTNAVQATKTVSWYRDQLSGHLNGFEFSIVNGHGIEPNGNSKIDTVRASYK